MPTGNEYSDVRLGGGDQSYKQTDREMSGGIEPQIGGPGNPLPTGNYPRVYDGVAGSEPLGQQSEDNPFYYPNKVYDYIKCSGPGQSYVTSERESESGEFGQCQPGETGPYPGTNIVPSPTPSMQFSSDKVGDPKALLEQTRASVMRHSDMNLAQGLSQPVATLGSHPWLRDGLTDPTDAEPGNAMPYRNIHNPLKG